MQASPGQQPGWSAAGAARRARRRRGAALSKLAPTLQPEQVGKLLVLYNFKLKELAELDTKSDQEVRQ